MRKLFIILAIIFCVNISQVYAADTALEDMTADTSPTDDDLIYSLNDPAGTPADRKVTWANIWAYMYSKITATIGSSYDTSAELDALFAAKQDALTFGIADTNALQVDATAGAPNDNEIARFTATGIEGLTYAELATATQSANEGVLILSNLQGAVTDTQVPNTITIDQATLATTVTVSDDESTDDNQEIVFTTDNANLESDGDLTYNPSTGTLTATHLSGELEGSDLDIANATTEATIAANDLILIYDTSAGANRAMTRGNFVTGIGAGQAIILDLEDDGGNDSTDLGEIATKNDTNSVFTMPSADKLYIDLAQNWPQADTAVAASTQVITDNAIVTVDAVDAADNDFAKFTANGLEGRSYAEVLADLGIDSAANLESTLSMGAYFSDIAAATSEANFKAIVNLEIGTDVLAQQTIGISDNNLLEVDGTPNSGEVAIFTASGLNGNNEAEFKAAFNLEAGTDYEAVDADILRADTADTIQNTIGWGDDIVSFFGGTNAAYDWSAGYDETTDNRLEFTHTAGADADVYWDLNDNAAASTFYIVNSNGTYAANLSVDGTISQGGALLSATYQPLHGYLTDIAAISSPTLGDLMYFDGTDWVALAPGTNGYFLQSQGDGSALTWASGSSTGVNETYGSGWDADPSAPEKDDVYDWGHLFDTDDDGYVNVLDPVDTGDENATFYFVIMDGATGAQVVETDAGMTYNPSTNVLTFAAGGGIVVTPNATAAQYSDYYEDTDDGSNYHRIQGQAFAANRTSTLPDYNIGFLASTQVDSGGDLADGAVDPAHLADADFGIFTISSGVASLDANTVDSDAYVDGSIDPEHVASGAWDFGTSLEADTLTEGGVGVPNTGDNLSVFAATTLAQLFGVLSDEGTGVETALGVNVGSVGAVVVNGGALGTPTSGDGTNILTGISTTLPGTCTAGQTYIDTDADTDGSLYICVTTDTWKEVDDDGGAGSGDLISEGDSNVEVIDTGSGQIDFDIDGANYFRMVANLFTFGTTTDFRLATTTSGHNYTFQIYDNDGTSWIDAIQLINNNTPSVTYGAVAVDLSSALSLTIPTTTSGDQTLTVGMLGIKTDEDLIVAHGGANGEVQDEVGLSLLQHISFPFDPSAWYDQESTYRSVPIMRIGDDFPHGFTITEWRVTYVGGDPTTELDADLICDTTPDFNTAAGATVMDVLDTTTGASSADTGFDSATCANGSELYIHFGADPTDANVVVQFDLWGYAEED